MWTSNTMTFWESIVTFMMLAEAEKNNQEEVERLAVIISAISEEMREPVERFTIVSITEI